MPGQGRALRSPWAYHDALRLQIVYFDRDQALPAVMGAWFWEPSGPNVYTEAGSGAIALSGTTTVSLRTTITATGGATTTGAAVASTRASVSSTGTTTLAGSADVETSQSTQTYTHVASGGIALTGTCSLAGKPPPPPSTAPRPRPAGRARSVSKADEKAPTPGRWGRGTRYGWTKG